MEIAIQSLWNIWSNRCEQIHIWLRHNQSRLTRFLMLNGNCHSISNRAFHPLSYSLTPDWFHQCCVYSEKKSIPNCHDGNLVFIGHRSISYEAINLRIAIHFISPYSTWRCSALAQRLICEIYIRYTTSFPFLPRRLPQSTEVVAIYIYIYIYIHIYIYYIYTYIYIYYWLFDLYVFHKYFVLHFIYMKSTITENVKIGEFMSWMSHQ